MCGAAESSPGPADEAAEGPAGHSWYCLPVGHEGDGDEGDRGKEPAAASSATASALTAMYVPPWPILAGCLSVIKWSLKPSAGVAGCVAGMLCPAAAVMVVLQR